MNYYKEKEILQYFVEARLLKDADTRYSIDPNGYYKKLSDEVNTTFTISDILHKFYKNYRNEDWAVQAVKKFLNELTNFGVLFKIPNFGPRGGFGYSFNRASIDECYFWRPDDISIVTQKIASKIINKIWDNYINPPVKIKTKICRCSKCGAFKKKNKSCKNCLNKKNNKTIKNYGYKIY